MVDDWLNWFHSLFIKVGLLVIQIDCMIFLSQFLDVTRMSSFFRRTARPWNSLPIECFPLTYGLKDFKSRINRHLLSVGFCYTDFLYAITFSVLLFLVSPCLIVAVQPCME